MLKVRNISKELIKCSISTGVPSIFIELTETGGIKTSLFSSKSNMDNDNKYVIYETANSIKGFCEIVENESMNEGNKIGLVCFGGSEPLKDELLDLMITLCNCLTNIYNFRVDLITSLANGIEDLKSNDKNSLLRLMDIFKRLMTFDGKIDDNSRIVVPEIFRDSLLNERITAFGGEIEFSRSKAPYYGMFITVLPVERDILESNNITSEEIERYYIEPIRVLEPSILEFLLNTVRYVLIFDGLNDKEIKSFITSFRKVLNEKTTNTIYRGCDFASELVSIYPKDPNDSSLLNETKKVAIKNNIRLSVV